MGIASGKSVSWEVGCCVSVPGVGLLSSSGSGSVTSTGSGLVTSEIVGSVSERSRNLDRSFRNIYIIPSFPTREQHAHSVQNARLRFNKLNQ